MIKQYITFDDDYNIIEFKEFNSNNELLHLMTYNSLGDLIYEENGLGEFKRTSINKKYRTEVEKLTKAKFKWVYIKDTNKLILYEDYGIDWGYNKIENKYKKINIDGFKYFWLQKQINYLRVNGKYVISLIKYCDIYNRPIIMLHKKRKPQLIYYNDHVSPPLETIIQNSKIKTRITYEIKDKTIISPVMFDTYMENFLKINKYNPHFKAYFDNAKTNI